MVTLSSVSRAGASLYLDIRQIEVRRDERAEVCYCLTGMVGDGCDEALVRVELGESHQVDIVPICSEENWGATLVQRVDTGELTRLILDALTRVYFCVEALPGRRVPGRISGYVDSGRLYRLHEERPTPHLAHAVAETGPSWQAA